MGHNGVLWLLLWNALIVYSLRRLVFPALSGYSQMSCVGHAYGHPLVLTFSYSYSMLVVHSSLCSPNSVVSLNTKGLIRKSYNPTSAFSNYVHIFPVFHHEFFHRNYRYLLTLSQHYLHEI